MTAHAETNGNGKSVSKNWLIGILIAIIAGLTSLSIVQHLNANEKTADAVTSVQMDIREIKAGINDLNFKVNQVAAFKLKELP